MWFDIHEKHEFSNKHVEDAEAKENEEKEDFKVGEKQNRRAGG